MRKTLFALCALAILAASGCNSGSGPEQVASKFLTDFFRMDYAAAGALCSEEIASSICDTSAVTYPSEEIRAKVEEASRGTTFEVTGAEAAEDGDAMLVSYEIHPFGASAGASISRTMRLSKIDGKWVIVSLKN